jgi:type I restriction enzyme S subunit
MQGIKVLSLSKSQLGKTQLLFPPDINEQKRIAELLAGIDAHIAVAQSHLDKMQSLKMGFLQQLFV